MHGFNLKHCCVIVNPCFWIVTVKTVYMERKRKRNERKKEKKRDKRRDN